MKESIKSLLKYFVTFAIVIVFCEIVMRLQMGRGIKPGNMHYLWFVPAESLFFAMLCGFGKKKAGLVNRIVTPVLVFIISFYFVAQLIYYRNFGSPFSISMMGMGGDALGNFWWALKDTFVASLGWIFVMAIPFIVTLVFSIIGKPVKWDGYSMLLHGITLFVIVAFWFLGILGLRLGGNDKQSAYTLFFNTLADTDTVSEKFGTLTTTILEGGSFYFGIGSEQSNLAAVNMDDAMLGKSEKTTSENKVVTPVTTTDADQPVEEVVEFIPEPHMIEQIDFNELKKVAPDNLTSSMCDFFASRKVTNTNEYTGMFEGYNLIYICAEAYSAYALDENVNPTLYKMAHNGIVLPNFYNSFKNTTTNGEFAFSTSLWPDVSRQATCGTDVGSFPQSSSKFMPQGLGDLFEANGINTYAYHNYFGEYYRRSLSWPNLGYKNIKFTGSGMHFTCNWPASDYEMIQQSIDDYINEDQFHAYYMTFSGHGPYTSSNGMYNRNIGFVRDNIGERASGLTDVAMGYLAGNHELDKAMEYLLQRLEEAGKLDNTVIVICGDHYPYYMDDKSADSLVGHEMDRTFEMYNTGVIIYNAGMEEPLVNDTYCCNVDLAPTMLNLFNIDYDSRLFMGNDIFSDDVVHKATIYNLSFMTDLVAYNSANGEATWTEAASEYSQEELDKYLDAMISLVEGEYEASTNIISNNFYKFVWMNSGLMTPEEARAEEQRAAQVEEIAQSINFKNAQAEAEKQAAEDAEKAAEAQSAAQANGWVFDPKTNLAYDPATGVIYEPTTGQAIGNMQDLQNPQPEAPEAEVN